MVYVPDVQIQLLRQILSRRRHFARLCTSQVNAAKYLLRSVGQGAEAASLKTWRAWSRLLNNPAFGPLRVSLSMHGEVWQLAHQKVLALEKQLEGALEPFQGIVDRLRTVPGVGLITAATFVAALGTVERFPDSARVVSYIGLAPSTYNSGEQERHGHITKRGSAELRAMLCEAAHHASSARHPLHPYFARTCARQGYKKAVVGIAQRLARILFQMWRRAEDFDPSKLNVVREKHVRTRTIYWRIRKPTEQLARA
jgi:transposase